MLGYTGILSFGHGMFFGIGAYCVAFLVSKYGAPTYLNLMLGMAIAAAVASGLAILISFLSLRVKTIFFAMVTLAIAELAIILATKLSVFTGGEDGISLAMPGIFSFAYSMGKFLGMEITGKIVTYYLILLSSSWDVYDDASLYAFTPLVGSFRQYGITNRGLRPLVFKTFVFQGISITFSCVMAAITGGFYAMWVGYVNPESCLGVFAIMLAVLLMCIIGGMGTLYGGIVGAAFYLITETFLPDLQHLAKDLFPSAVFLHNVLERWYLFLGVLFILVIIFFPKGVIGSVREFIDRRK